MALFTLRQVSFKNLINYPELALEPERVTFICGESGSGKSTLLKMLNGMVTPDKGEVTFRGRAIKDWDPLLLRRTVLLAGQAPYLFNRSIKENFQEFYHYRALPPPSEAEMRRYLELCALENPLDHNCSALSGGEKQRVFLAICLSLKPEVLLLDEPTSALDDHNATLVLENIKKHSQANRLTLLVVSHNQDLCRLLADDLVTL